jgi:hypothetical protein
LSRVQKGVLILGILLVDLEFYGLWLPNWEIGTGTIRELQVFLAIGWVGQGIVFLDETSGSSNQIQAHQFAPIIGVRTVLESCQGARGALMPFDKFDLPDVPKEVLGS